MQLFPLPAILTSLQSMISKRLMEISIRKTIFSSQISTMKQMMKTIINKMTTMMETKSRRRKKRERERRKKRERERSKKRSKERKRRKRREREKKRRRERKKKRRTRRRMSQTWTPPLLKHLSKSTTRTVMANLIEESTRLPNTNNIRML